MRFFIRLWDQVFNPEQEKKNRTKYLLVSSNEYYRIPHVLGEDRAFTRLEFSTKKDVLDYLNNHVAKSDKSYWKIYKREASQQETK